MEHADPAVRAECEDLLALLTPVLKASLVSFARTDASFSVSRALMNSISFWSLTPRPSNLISASLSWIVKISWIVVCVMNRWSGERFRDASVHLPSQAMQRLGSLGSSVTMVGIGPLRALLIKSRADQIIAHEATCQDPFAFFSAIGAVNEKAAFSYDHGPLWKHPY
ncbi:hypothetical protein CBA19CS22_39500 [Caballeronia novacaledonica]|uniref:Uncharacterized protein n=1 Tax=Caballeronia novacaledonica TaxID=1544861 RepID=A0ACB5R5S8_9BURK|nr:hypothetical protein CBA19CS22_39500 [Caballeronia novacaledonica]